MLCARCSASRYETTATRWALGSRMWTREEVLDRRRRTFFSLFYVLYCMRILAIASYLLNTSIRNISFVPIRTDPQPPVHDISPVEIWANVLLPHAVNLLCRIERVRIDGHLDFSSANHLSDVGYDQDVSSSAPSSTSSSRLDCLSTHRARSDQRLASAWPFTWFVEITSRDQWLYSSRRHALFS